MLKRPYLLLLSLTSVATMLFAYSFTFLLTMQSDNRYGWMKIEVGTQLPIDSDSPARVRTYIILIVILMLLSITSGFIKDKKQYFSNKSFWFTIPPVLYAVWRYLNLMNG